MCFKLDLFQKILYNTLVDTCCALHVNLITVQSLAGAFFCAQKMKIFFVSKKGKYFMPTTKFQKMVFAFITVVITVNLFVFYNLSYVNGLTFAQLEEYGVPIFDHSYKVWAVILIEFICAYSLEMFVGSPFSVKLALRVVDPSDNKPYMVETAIICATVGLMCPMMSFIATFLYSWSEITSLWAFIALWLRTIMHNLPLAFFSQLFFIQPFVRTVFGLIFKKQLNGQGDEWVMESMQTIEAE